jgi:hypothetical protein
MEDMLHYLDQQFSPPSEGRLRIVAVRHEDGSWGPTAYGYQEQRKRLFHDLAEVALVEVDDDADSEDPHEAGNIYVDLANLVVSVVVPLIAAWVSKEPREEKATLPGLLVLESGGHRLRIDHRVPDAERERLIEVFVGAAKAQSGAR